MAYDYKKEYLQWLAWKKGEEKIMRDLNVKEEIINELRMFDKQLFNEDRKFKRRQNVTKEQFFIGIPVCDIKEISSINDILDNIENEALYHILMQCDKETLDIIMLKIMGYSVHDISIFMNIKVKAIYYKIRKLRKKISNILEK